MDKLITVNATKLLSIPINSEHSDQSHCKHTQSKAFLEGQNWPCTHLANSGKCLTMILVMTVVMLMQDGLIHFNVSSFWKEKTCPIHLEDNTPQCCSCSRRCPREEQWVTELDGRMVCLGCLSTIVRDTPDAQPLYNQVCFFICLHCLSRTSSQPPACQLGQKILSAWPACSSSSAIS